MDRTKLKQRLKKINPSCVLADHLFGKEHTMKHKMISGVLLMAFGVCISKIHIELAFAHYLMDGVGYFFHGMGGIPFGEYLATTQQVTLVEDE